jgi:lysine-N-methylase
MATLHFTRTLPALLPRYVSRFRCIGPQCEDTCCSGWQVAIDKQTFNAYRQVRQPELRSLLASHVKRQRSQASDANYARIELDPATRACPMMEEKLCTVQAKLDESYLSDTCFSYPRLSRNFGGQVEQALTLSCPEAARQALLAADAFDFIEAPVALRSATISGVAPRHGMSLELMNEVRIFCLKLMRTDGLALWQKLAVLGVFCESLTATLAKGGAAAVPALQDSFVMLVEQGLVLDALADLQPNHAAQARVFSTIWQRRAIITPSALQNGVFAAIAEGLGAQGDGAELAPELLVERYSRGVTRLPQALEAAPHLLENYILNEMFCDLFPFQGASPYEHYLQLVSRFGLLRLMLAARCTDEARLPGAEELVQTAQVYCRRFQHDTAFAAHVNLALKKTGWATLEKVFGFLRS